MDRTLKADIQHAIGVSKAKPESRVDARRRAREAGESAIAVLRSEGYYDYEVEPDLGDGDKPEPIVRINPGPRSTIARTEVVWDGAAPDPDTQAAAEKALALAKGGPGRAGDVLAAEGRVEAALRKRGYADAAIHPRQVVVDHEDHTVNPTFHFYAGGLVRLDGLKVVSQGRTKRKWIASLAPWKKGDIYDPAQVAKLEQRLRDAGVYNSVTVSLSPPDQAVNGLRPIIVSVGDRPAHTIELGGGYTSGGYPSNTGITEVAYSTSEGAGIDAKYILYNRLGQADTITFTGRLAQIQQKLDVELDLPDWKRADQILKVGADVFADDTDAFDDNGVGFRAAIERHWSRTSFIGYGGAVDIVDTREKTSINANGIAVGENLKLAIFSLTGQFSLDRSNDPLNPTRGWRVQAEADPTYVSGDRNLPYLKLQGQASGYLPFGADANTVLAARVKLGSIVGGSIPNVPADRRFFAGGGGSVRGFNYQGVGPQLADGTPIGGVSLFESSFEVRQRVKGPWSIAAFIDAGSLGPTPAPDFSHVDVGAGLGVRYDLGFGPIRLDLATPVTRSHGDPWVQLYISIGQSF
ncbi:MAG TPA: autotransporter assembly complex family protein [Caulobacteraceae bacterium]|jgi:translocation and assembly module TamA|nr:autotransporter assembly complex family protein [Caulobacteraceae bacterium]